MANIRRTQILLIVIFFFTDARAWLYPEHKKLLCLAVQNLSYANRQQLESIWFQARLGYEKRLSKDIVTSASVPEDNHIDFASWAAIAGDHSCSPSEMLSTVLQSGWIFRVEKAGATLDDKLNSAKNRSDRWNAMHWSDLKLLQADDGYAGRAGANDAHFLLPRTNSSMTITEYLDSCTANNAGTNALQVYALFHMAALEKAYKYATHSHLSQMEKSSLLLSAMADEAFALHFLQDAFAAGHAAGTWGKPALKKGTHDTYNEKGLEVVTWRGNRMVIYGDAWLNSDYAALIAEVCGLSLQQLIKAYSGTIKMLSDNTPMMFSNLSVCTSGNLPQYRYDKALLLELIDRIPMPGLRKGAGSLPRTGAELGSFFGVSAGLAASSLSGGFGAQQNIRGTLAGLEANVVFGIGMEGVLNRSGDGLAFIKLGWKQEGASSNNIEYYPDPTAVSASALASAIPARTAYTVRVRVPYYLIPGDLLVAAPILSLISPKTLDKMAVHAVNGGLLGLQSGIASSIGRFQFMLGREIGISFFGLSRPKDFIIIPESANTTFVEFRSTRFDFPVLEYIPMRTFTESQTSSMLIQFNIGVDIPYGTNILSPTGGHFPRLKTVWHTGIRILFNWRKYL